MFENNKTSNLEKQMVSMIPQLVDLVCQKQMFINILDTVD